MLGLQGQRKTVPQLRRISEATWGCIAEQAIQIHKEIPPTLIEEIRIKTSVKQRKGPINSQYYNQAIADLTHTPKFPNRTLPWTTCFTW